jgi:hypothetical protein
MLTRTDQAAQRWQCVPYVASRFSRYSGRPRRALPAVHDEQVAGDHADSGDAR